MNFDNQHTRHDESLRDGLHFCLRGQRVQTWPFCDSTYKCHTQIWAASSQLKQKVPLPADRFLNPLECGLCVQSDIRASAYPQAPIAVYGQNVRWGTRLGKDLGMVDTLWSGLTDTHAGGDACHYARAAVSHAVAVRGASCAFRGAGPLSALPVLSDSAVRERHMSWGGRTSK